MDKKLLTIAIPTYNRENLLKRLLKSIEQPIDDSVEILVSDNASIDNTANMVFKEFPFVRYYSNNHNIGADANFLECYKRASGQYVWLIGSDDIVIKGAVNEIVQFLKKNKENNLSLIFLNHNYFKGDYNEKCNNKLNYLNDNIINGNTILYNKNEFVKITGRQLTFMSSFLLRKADFLSIDNPQKFINTHFIHTYLALQISENASCFGVVYYPCVSQDLSPDNSGLSRNFEKIFEVFGKYMYEVIVNYAILKGYEKEIVRYAYIKDMVKTFAFWVANAKVVNDKKGLDSFWLYAYPVLKSYYKPWLFVFPLALLPSCFSRMYLKTRVMLKNVYEKSK